MNINKRDCGSVCFLLIIFSAFTRIVKEKSNLNMKHQSFLYISLITLISISGCNNTSTNKNKTKGSSYSDIIPQGPSINKDATLSFTHMTDACMVTPRVKAYVDAMKEQEKTLEYPYRLSPLYGPENYEENALKDDTPDNTIYDREDTGGVDVCGYLNRNDYRNTCENVPIKISWSKGNLDYKKALVKYWSKADKSDVKYVEANADQVSAELPNLYRNTEYRYQVIADSKTTRYTSQEVKFKTDDYPRTITMGNIKNVRDIGGFMTSYGIRTNQGLIYRGCEIEDQDGGNGVNYDENCQKVQDSILHIGHELDLRSNSDANNRKESALSKESAPVSYSRATVFAYDSFINDESSTKNLATIFSIFANADKEHVYFHCLGGADQTGMVAFFLNAILGVSYTDLIIDYELTTETNNKRCHMHNSTNAHFPKFIDAFTKYSGYDDDKTLNQNCEQFLIDKGVSLNTIEKIRDLMLPGYKKDMKEVEPKYTQTDKLMHDDFGHWYSAKENSLVRCDYHKHTYVNDESKNNTSSTCSTHGEEYKICAVCGHGAITTLPLTEHEWVDGPAIKNSDNKDVITINCENCKQFGSKINVNDYSSATFDSDDDKVIDNIRPSQKQPITYKIIVPSSGSYAISIGMKNTKNDAHLMIERGFKVSVNDEAPSMVDYGDKTADGMGLNAETATQIPLVSAINFHQGENVVSLTCSGYRLVYSGYLIVTHNYEILP